MFKLAKETELSHLFKTHDRHFHHFDYKYNCILCSSNIDQSIFQITNPMHLYESNNIDLPETIMIGKYRYFKKDKEIIVGCGDSHGKERGMIVYVPLDFLHKDQEVIYQKYKTQILEMVE